MSLSHELRYNSTADHAEAFLRGKEPTTADSADWYLKHAAVYEETLRNQRDTSVLTQQSESVLQMIAQLYTAGISNKDGFILTSQGRVDGIIRSQELPLDDPLYKAAQLSHRLAIPISLSAIEANSDYQHQLSRELGIIPDYVLKIGVTIEPTLQKMTRNLSQESQQAISTAFYVQKGFFQYPDTQEMRIVATYPPTIKMALSPQQIRTADTTQKSYILSPSQDVRPIALSGLTSIKKHLSA